MRVDRTTGIAVGEQVLVALGEAANHSLKTYLYSDDPGDIRRGKQLDTRMLLRVVAIDGECVRFDRPLRFATRAEWQPEIRSFQPTVTEAGVEGIGFAFPPATYRGHFKENGSNALEMRLVYNCWIRNVAIHNGDLGISIVACGNTVDGVTITGDPGRGMREGGVDECTGHHAIQCVGAEDNLVTRFDLQTSYIHDLAVAHASGNIFAEGRGLDLNFDHHKDTPYENLFTDIDCGRGTRVWRSGGGTSLGRRGAGWETFWNIRAAQPLSPPPDDWGPTSMNFVALFTKDPSAIEQGSRWFGPVPPEQIQPRNLPAAQLARRLAARGASAGIGQRQ